MAEMNGFICNKCYAPTYRGKHPYHITQCGHIFCQSCIQQAEKECPQCQRVGTMSLALEEPLMPKLIPYFQPFGETLEMLLKVDTFRSNQQKVMMQRYLDLDKKYEILKTRYWTLQRKLKELMEKYMQLKNENENLEKGRKLLLLQRGTPRYAYHRVETPISDSGISSVPSISGYSRQSSEYPKFAKYMTPMRSIDPKRQRRTDDDDFLIPTGTKVPKTVRSVNMLS